MKRAGSDYDDRRGRSGKRSRVDSYQEALDAGKYELRVLVTTRGAGGVIGRGGENIKRLRTEFEANISVPDSQTPERVMTMTAKVDNLISCLRDMIPRLDENRDDDRDRGRRRSPDRSDSELRVLVHESHAGAIIGRGGSRIKELREKSGAQLKVFSHCAPQSTERIVVMNGGVEKICDCVTMIIDILKEIPIKGMVRPYDPLYYDPSGYADYGGYMPDRAYLSRPMRNLSSTRYGGGRYDDYGRGMSPPPRDRYRDSLRYGSPIPSIRTTTQVTIPDELGGAIIGKGGSRINRVREESGAEIEVEPQRGGGGDRIITITGTREQIQAAQYLLQQCVRSSEAGRRYLSSR